eukprot:31530-Pelagococcus_subviridis.AAC.9
MPCFAPSVRFFPGFFDPPPPLASSPPPPVPVPFPPPFSFAPAAPPAILAHSFPKPRIDGLDAFSFFADSSRFVATTSTPPGTAGSSPIASFAASSCVNSFTPLRTSHATPIAAKLWVSIRSPVASTRFTQYPARLAAASYARIADRASGKRPSCMRLSFPRTLIRASYDPLPLRRTPLIPVAVAFPSLTATTAAPPSPPPSPTAAATSAASLSPFGPTIASSSDATPSLFVGRPAPAPLRGGGGSAGGGADASAPPFPTPSAVSASVGKFSRSALTPSSRAATSYALAASSAVS